MSKDKRSGYTRKTKDWLGQEKEEHFDPTGKKIGETRFTKGFLGFSPKQEHFNSRNEKIGETRSGANFLGDTRAEHFNAKGKPIGYSKNTTKFFGGVVQKHYDLHGNVVGTSERCDDGLKGIRREHKGVFYKAEGASQSQNPVPSGTACPTSSYDYSGSTSSGSYVSSPPRISTHRIRFSQVVAAIYAWLCIALWSIYIYGCIEYRDPGKSINHIINGLSQLCHLTADSVFNFIIATLLVLISVALVPGFLMVGFYLLVTALVLGLSAALVAALASGLISLARISATGTVVAVVIGILAVWALPKLIQKAAPWTTDKVRGVLSILLPGAIQE